MNGDWVADESIGYKSLKDSFPSCICLHLSLNLAVPPPAEGVQGCFSAEAA